MRTFYLSMLFCCMISLAQAQLRQQIGLSFGGSMSWSTTKQEDVLSEDAGFYHKVAGAYGISWLGQLDNKNSLRVSVRKAQVDSGFKIDWFNVPFEEYIGTSRSSSFIHAPFQLQVNWLRKLRQLGKKWAVSGHIGLAYAYDNSYTLNAGGGTDLVTRTVPRQLVRTFEYRLYSVEERAHNLLFNLGSEMTFTNAFNQALVFRLDAQFGLLTAIKRRAEYSLQDHEAGTIQYGSAERLIRGSNFTFTIGYRFPFMERHYQRRLKRRNDKK